MRKIQLKQARIHTQSKKSAILAVINKLKKDEAVPISDICAEFNVSRSYVLRLVSDNAMLVYVEIDGRPEACASAK